MTDFVLRPAQPSLRDWFARFGQAVTTLIETFVEAQAMAREAQRRYPYVIE